LPNGSTRWIRKDAACIERWLDDGRTVFVYYNNDAEGHAVHDAERLGQALSEGG